MSLIVAVTEHVQHHLAYRVCRVPAVVLQVLVRRVTCVDLVHPVGLDQLQERCPGNVERPDGLLQGDHVRMPRSTFVAEIQFALPSIKRS